MTSQHPDAPSPEHRPTERIHHGDVVVDPYEWMRDKTDPEVIAHLEAENAYADARTAHLGALRARLVEEFVGHTQETDLSVPVRRGDWWYITRTTAGDDYPKFTRVADAGSMPQVEPGVMLESEQVLLDAQAEAAGHEFYSLGGLTLSPDHNLLAYAVDTAGDERFTLRVLDLSAGEVLDESVAGTGYGIAFSTDQQWLFYARVDDAWRQHQVWRHRIGADPAEDVLVLEEGDERFMIGFERSRDETTLVIQSASTTTAEAWLLDLAAPESAPVPAGGRRDGVDYAVEHAGDRLLVVHNDGHTGFALAQAPLEAPDQWEELLVAGEGERLLAVESFAGFVALELRAGGLASVRIIPRAADGSLRLDQAEDLTHGGELDTVELDANPNWDQQAVRYELTSLLTPPTVAEREVATGATEILRVTPVPRYDPSLYVERREWATAADGTAIPLSVVARKEVAADGTAPGYLYGYGSYEVSIDPSFVPTRLSLLDRGVVIAIAHVRGGGEMGRDWYDHGKLQEKKNSFSDFDAAAEHLGASGLVDPARLGAEGRSAGGLLMGAVANLAPERFRAIIAGVPFVDALTTILDPSLPLTVGEWEEWGDPLHDPSVYEYMKEYTPYENVQAVEYPAIFASTSLNDTRVFFVEPAKWVARLRETVTSDQAERPIVFRCEMVAGHGGRSGRYRKWEQRADELAWLLDQLGAIELL
ncbi:MULTISPECIES: S9 family peptidase [Brachybacterium]|uniref:Oligopeptidase B n=2 Tax=Brachybacterium TaxID=43668 RepID=A0A3R8QU23_9MICO|nr:MULTISPECIES: S9 family peptidase [Brachybacterium]RRR17983.1 oligopeptidase B [Brachybacterium paraconglomeratum]GLI29262.1 oligopeptidase B [Brachybacterium conglomeratum]GLK05592.1 oligopeptidase B [Brachybacterium conglomeratum]